MKVNTRTVWEYIKAHDGEDFTAVDIAEATGLSSRQVNGIITAAFQRYKDEDKNPMPLAVREEVEIETEDGTHEKIKLIRLTDEGRAWVAPED